MSAFYRSYYEANDVTSAIEIVEEAFTKHQSLVSMEDVNIAAELYISSKQYDRALAVRTAPGISVSFEHLLASQNGWFMFIVHVPAVLGWGPASVKMELIRNCLLLVL